MQDLAASPLVAWESFYVIVGSSSAALTGLMFVVVSLIPEAGLSSSGESIEAFGTPTIVHFCAALLVSAIVSAPWHLLLHPGLLVAVTGLAGAGYVVVVVRRARRQQEYQPVLEDWVWHCHFPLAAYLTLTVAGVMLSSRPIGALFGIGAATLFLVFIGIHNAWDTVMYITLHRLRSRNGPKA